jgi:hypothetical protein
MMFSLDNFEQGGSDIDFSILRTYRPIDTASIFTGNRIFNTSFQRLGAGAQDEKRRSTDVTFLYSLHLMFMILIQEKKRRREL